MGPWYPWKKFPGTQMLSRVLPYALAAALGLLALSEHRSASEAREARDRYADDLDKATGANGALSAQLERQKQELDGLKQQATKAEQGANAAASSVMGTLPAALEKDRAGSSDPKDMNLWLDSLFSP